jgi:flagellar basal-body rod protein FlgB
VIPQLFNATTLPALQEVVGFAQARHDVLAGNVANYGTPGYKVRDLSLDNFQERLRDAIDVRDKKTEPLSPGVIQPAGNGEMTRVREAFKDVLYHDQTNVSLEHQVNEISKNQLLHSMAITVMTSQFRLLQTAISERV